MLIDEGNFVVLIKSSILGQSDGPSELVSLTCMFMTQQQLDKVDGSTSKLMVAPWGQQTPGQDN